MSLGKSISLSISMQYSFLLFECISLRHMRYQMDEIFNGSFTQQEPISEVAIEAAITDLDGEEEGPRGGSKR